MKKTTTDYYVDIAKKVDIFSLGVVMATLLNKYQIFASKPDREQIKMYRSLVQEAMNGNPFKRISIDDLITRLEGLMKKSVYASAQSAKQASAQGAPTSAQSAKQASAHTSVPSDRVGSRRSYVGSKCEASFGSRRSCVVVFSKRVYQKSQSEGSAWNDRSAQVTQSAKTKEERGDV